MNTLFFLQFLYGRISRIPGWSVEQHSLTTGESAVDPSDVGSSAISGESWIGDGNNPSGETYLGNYSSI